MIHFSKNKYSMRYKLYWIASGFLLWTLFTWWRANYLGFYSDDWVFLSKTTWSPITLFQYIATNFFSRPTYGFITWFLNIIADGDPLKWQLISSATVLASGITAFKIFRLTLNKMGYTDQPSLLGALIGAAVLTISPWALATFAWPTGVLTLWGFILFGVGYALIDSDALSKKILGALIACCGFLTYEAYWFSFVPFLLISSNFDMKRIRGNIASSFYFIASIFFSILYQRFLLPLFGFENPKSVSLNYQLIVNNVFRIDEFVSKSIQPIPWKYFSGCILMLIIFLLLFRAISFRRLAWVFFSVTVGIVISAGMYAIAGYGFSGVGVMSRTLAAPSLYFALAISVLAAAASKQSNMKLIFLRSDATMSAFFIAMISMMLVGFSSRISEWALVQQQSRDVLQAIKSEFNKNYFRMTTEDSFSVVVQIDGDPNGEIFGAHWELTGGVALAAPNLVPGLNISFLTAREGAWSTVWDGKCVIQRVCTGSPENIVSSQPSAKAPLYLRLNPNSGQVLQRGTLAQGNIFGCDGIQPSI